MSTPTSGQDVTASSDPAVLRAQIDATRARMSEDVNALTDYAAPANVAQRQKDKVRGAVGSAVGGVRDRVMGSAGDASSTASDAASSARDAVQGAPGAARSATQGNPLAAGLVALGVGWLVGSLLPASARETQAATAVKEHAGTVTAPLADAAKEAASNLREPAAQAAQSVKDSAAGAAATVKDEGASAAQHVQHSATDAKDTVRDSRA